MGFRNTKQKKKKFIRDLDDFNGGCVYKWQTTPVPVDTVPTNVAPHVPLGNPQLRPLEGIPIMNMIPHIHSPYRVNEPPRKNKKKKRKNMRGSGRGGGPIPYSHVDNYPRSLNRYNSPQNRRVYQHHEEVSDGYNRNSPFLPYDRQIPTHNRFAPLSDQASYDRRDFLDQRGGQRYPPRLSTNHTRRNDGVDPDPTHHQT